MTTKLPTVREPHICSRRAALQGLGLGVLSAASATVLSACTTSSRVPSGDSGVSPMDSGAPDSGAIDAGPTCASADICLDISDPANSVLASVDGSGIVNAGSDRIMIVRTAASGASAFAVVSSVCPHAACDVSYDASAHDLPCYCHGSLFGLDGSLRRGPAARGLRRYTWEFDGTLLTIHS